MAKTPFVSLIFITAFGLLLRLVSLDQSLWLDEAAQAIASQASLWQILTDRIGDFHPPLFYFLTHFWQQVSTADVWLRLLPVIFGTLTIPAIYALARVWLEDKSVSIFSLKISLPIVSSFLLALAPFHIYYSQEYRSYSLLCLLCTLSAIFIKRLHLRRSIIFLALINTLIIYTHYSGLIFLVTELAFVTLYSRSYLRRYLISLGLSALGFLPWLPYFYRQLTTGVAIDSYLPGWRQVLSLPTLTSLPIILFKLLAGRINLVSRYFYGLYAGGVIGYIFLTSFLTRRQLLYFWVFFPILITIVISLAIPQSQPFRLIYTLPWLLLIITQAAVRSPKTLLSLAIYISLFGTVMYFTRPRLQRENWRQAAAFLTRQSAPVVVKFPEPFAPLRWYAPDLPYIPSLTTFPSTPTQTAAHLQSSAIAPRLFLVNYLTDLTDPGRDAEAWLAQAGYTQGQTTDFPGVGFITEYRHATP